MYTITKNSQPAALIPLQAAEALHGLQDSLQLLQVYHRWYPDWLHHRCTALNYKALQRVMRKLHSTSPRPCCHPRRTYTPRSVERRQTGSLKTPTTPATNCSACCCLKDITAASSPAPPGSGTIISSRQ